HVHRHARLDVGVRLSGRAARGAGGRAAGLSLVRGPAGRPRHLQLRQAEAEALDPHSGNRVRARRVHRFRAVAHRSGDGLSARRRRGEWRDHLASQDGAPGRRLSHELRGAPRRQLAEQRRQPPRDHGDQELRVLRGALASRRAEARSRGGHRGRPERLRACDERAGARRRDRLRADRAEEDRRPVLVPVRSVLFDHVAIAVPRLADAQAILAAHLGGRSAYGMTRGAFSFWHWRYEGGGDIEVLEPWGADGFLHRFLARRGAGIYHVMFTVLSFVDVCDRAWTHGYSVVGYDDSDPDWKEAFLHPRQAQGIVVQFAETHAEAPSPPR